MSHTHHHRRDFLKSKHLSLDECDEIPSRDDRESRKRVKNNSFPSVLRHSFRENGYEGVVAADALSMLDTPHCKDKIEISLSQEVNSLLAEVRLHQSSLSQNKQMGVIHDLLRLGILKFGSIQELIFDLREGHFKGASNSSVALLQDAIYGEVQELAQDQNLKDKSFEYISSLAIIAISFLPKEPAISGKLVARLFSVYEESKQNFPSDSFYILRSVRRLLPHELIINPDFQRAFAGNSYEEIPNAQIFKQWLKAFAFLELTSSDWGDNITEDAAPFVKSLSFRQMLPVVLDLCRIGGATPDFLSFIQDRIQEYGPYKIEDLSYCARILSHFSDPELKHDWRSLIPAAAECCMRMQNPPSLTETKELMQIIYSFWRAVREGVIKSNQVLGFRSDLQTLMGAIGAGKFKDETESIPVDILLGYIQASGEVLRICPQPYIEAVEYFLNSFAGCDTTYGASSAALDVSRAAIRLRTISKPIFSQILSSADECLQRGDLPLATKLVSSLVSITVSNPDIEDRSRLKNLFSKIVVKIPSSSSYWSPRSAVLAKFASKFLEIPFDPEIEARFDNLSKAVSIQSSSSKFEEEIGNALLNLDYSAKKNSSLDRYSQSLEYEPNLHGYFVDFIITKAGRQIAIEAHGVNFHTAIHVDKRGRCIETFVDGHTLAKEEYLKLNGIPTLSIWSNMWEDIDPNERLEYLRNEITAFIDRLDGIDPLA